MIWLFSAQQAGKQTEEQALELIAQHKLKTVGVLTGFDDYALLENEHPDVILESVASLKHYFTFP